MKKVNQNLVARTGWLTSQNNVWPTRPDYDLLRPISRQPYSFPRKDEQAPRSVVRPCESRVVWTAPKPSPRSITTMKHSKPNVNVATVGDSISKTIVQPTESAQPEAQEKLQNHCDDMAKNPEQNGVDITDSQDPAKATKTNRKSKSKRRLQRDQERLQRFKERKASLVDLPFASLEEPDFEAVLTMFNPDMLREATKSLDVELAEAMLACTMVQMSLEESDREGVTDDMESSSEQSELLYRNELAIRELCVSIVASAG